MTILGRLLDKRMLTPTQAWGRSLDWGGARAATGETIDLDKAMTLPVFQRCVNLYVDDIAQLPWDVYRRAGNSRVAIDPPGWMESPTLDPSYTWTDHVSDVVFSLVTDRNAFLRCYPTRYNITAIEVLEAEAWEVVTTGGGPRYVHKRTRQELTPLEVVHIRAPKSPGKARATSRVSMLRETIALGLAAEAFGAQFFADGATMSGMVEVPAGATVDPVQLREQMEKGHKGLKRSHAIGVLTGGATWKQTQSNARDSQLLELHESVIEDVARGFGIPPYLVGSTSPGAVAYASTSNARVDHVVHGIVGLVHRMEIAYSALVPGADTFTRLGLNALLRGDATTRFTSYGSLLDKRIVTRQEVRDWEDWGPADEAAGVDSENGGYLDTPNNNAPEPAAQPMPVPAARALPSPPEEDVPSFTVNVNQPDMARASDQLEALAIRAEERAEAAEQRALAAERRMAELITRSPVVNVAAPVVNLAPADVTVNVPEQAAPTVRVVNQMPDVQNMRIVGLPPMDARVRRDKQGRIETVEG